MFIVCDVPGQETEVKHAFSDSSHEKVQRPIDRILTLILGPQLICKKATCLKCILIILYITRFGMLLETGFTFRGLEFEFAK